MPLASSADESVIHLGVQHGDAHVKLECQPSSTEKWASGCVSSLATGN